jgi:prepilin-type N-terminal cleavage/methylation domain-containing protein
MKETNTMKTAFTLIEILIVVILLGVLAAIVVPQFAETTDDAKTSACRANEKAIVTACSLYRLKENVDPDAMSDLTATSTNNADKAYLPEEPKCGSDTTATYTIITGKCSFHSPAAGI